ncbi:MAG: transcriptional regulator, ArsR family [Caulobacter sp.]|jgi:DNA-binding transcriptional ArsR family regulator|nr:transcriptional regulator, ArsR family [Caulobacter sp.]
MEQTDAVSALSALAHPGRLAIFRLLVRAGPAGMAAGDIGRATDMLANTLSSNLGILSQAGLAASRREGRSIIYRADYGTMGSLLAFLMEDCCAGEPAICAPAIAAAQAGACGAKSC